MSNQSKLVITERRLPHWQLDGSIYFITFRLERGELNVNERSLVGQHFRAGHQRFYLLFSYVVMPDHVHLLIKPNPGIELSRIMKGIKGVSAHLVNEVRGCRGQIWQYESFDRIVRDEAEFLEKIDYILSNPVKAGIAKDGRDYDGWYIDLDACFGADKNVCPTKTIPHSLPT